jgi:hypothetical protein
MKPEQPEQPEPCDREIYEKGKHLCTIVGPRSFTLDPWVKEIAKESGQRVDWHYVGGRACVLVIGDAARVRTAIEAAWTRLVDAYMACEHNFTTHPERRDVQISWSSL